MFLLFFGVNVVEIRWFRAQQLSSMRVIISIVICSTKTIQCLSWFELHARSISPNFQIFRLSLLCGNSSIMRMLVNDLLQSELWFTRALLWYLRFLHLSSNWNALQMQPDWCCFISTKHSQTLSMMSFSIYPNLYFYWKFPQTSHFSLEFSMSSCAVRPSNIPDAFFGACVSTLYYVERRWR